MERRAVTTRTPWGVGPVRDTGPMGARRWWDEQVVPRLTDRGLNDATAGPWRTTVCGGATGAVLEIGFGSGRNLAYYPAR